MAVSTSAQEFFQVIELAGDEICQGKKRLILSNDTIMEQDERRLFSLGVRSFDVEIIYHRMV
jgi:hypothetical protein